RADAKRRNRHTELLEFHLLTPGILYCTRHNARIARPGPRLCGPPSGKRRGNAPADSGKPASILGVTTWIAVGGADNYASARLLVANTILLRNLFGGNI